MAKARILIVDDDVKYADMLKTGLEQRGYDVKTASRAEDGVALARAFRPSVVLLDVVMPEMDGGEVAAQLRDDPQLRAIPVVFFTSSVTKEEVESGGGVIGGQPFLAKPAGLSDVVRCIEQQLSRPPSSRSGAP